MADAAGDKGAELNRVSTGQSITKAGEFGYPQGHLGHLTADQADALEKFKQLAATDGHYTQAQDGKPASHDEATMLRFLRARRFVPKDALGQFRDTEVWRKANHIDDLYDNIDVGDYEETRRLYPQWTGRRDKRGIPVYCFEVAPLNSGTMSKYLKSSETTKVLNVPLGDKKSNKKNDAASEGIVPPRLLRLFALYENLLAFTMPLCTQLKDRPNPETPISQSNNIVDISKVGLKQFWNLRSHMQDASTLATAHYPETLDRIFIVGAPSFFPTVWSWVKRWFDPITVSKIFILTEASAFKTLSSFIEPENIPKKYGGGLEWNWGDKPVLDPEEAAHLKFAAGYGSEKTPDGEPKTSAPTWPTGPLRWRPRAAAAGNNNLGGGDDDDGNTWDLLAVGSLDGKERREVVGSLNFNHLALTKAASRQPSRPATSGRKSAADVKVAADAAGTADLPAHIAATEGATAAVAAAGIAKLSVNDGAQPAAPAVPTETIPAPVAAAAATTPAAAPADGVAETAPIPPQPLITPEVPLKAIASDLPAATPGEVQKQL